MTTIQNVQMKKAVGLLHMITKNAVIQLKLMLNLACKQLDESKLAYEQALKANQTQSELYQQVLLAFFEAVSDKEARDWITGTVIQLTIDEDKPLNAVEDLTKALAVGGERIPSRMEQLTIAHTAMCHVYKQVTVYKQKIEEALRVVNETQTQLIAAQTELRRVQLMIT